MPTVEIVCLANSWKRGGRCVAGLRTDGTGWIRPVSLEPQGVLRAEHYQLAWGREAALLDILNVRLSGPQPAPHHPENWLIDSGRWKRCRPVPSQRLLGFLDQSLSLGPELLGDFSEKVSYATFQRRPAAESLALVRPESLSWQVRRKPTGKPKIRACFVLAGAFYSLPLTDPVCLTRLAGLPDGDHAWDKPGREPLLTISLGEPFGTDADCYKIVAGVITLSVSSQNEGKRWPIIWDWILGRAG